MDAKKEREHRERVEAWGPSPDVLSFDSSISRVISLYGVRPEDVLGEIAWRRRHSGDHHFCSRRTLAREPTRHRPLETLPTTFPPTRLKIGTSKDAAVIVERMLPASRYDVEYSSSTKSACYLIRTGQIPYSQTVALAGQRVSSIIAGHPDDRQVERARNVKLPLGRYVELIVQTDYSSNHTAAAVRRPTSYEIAEYPTAFAQGKIMTLPQALGTDPDSMGRSIHKRPLLEMCQLRIVSDGGIEDIIAALPVSKEARNPNFPIDGFFRDVMLDCHVARTSDVHIPQIAAAARAAQELRLNQASSGILERLRKIS